ncbi:MAG: T9SS type A sorting domain-containing protein [Bacteroidales bacterium]
MFSYNQNILETPLKYPWAGGLNSCQFGKIDINLDGIEDLVIFDRQGNRILPFINEGIPDSISYSFHPELVSLFPELHDWVFFYDYDCDGKKDIFTYGNGSIRVFHNISDTVLKFELVTNMIESYYYNGLVGILGTTVDYPAISDIDGDGAVDILTFFGLGSYIEYHRNLSIQNYGNCDSLDYKLTNSCWGNFMESAYSDSITLNIVCPYKKSPIMFSCSETEKDSKHVGSTLLTIDLNNDGVKDLLTGGINFPNIIALYNGGTRDSAHMVSVDTLFPSYSKPVHLFDFPCPFFIDIDNDSINDLIVSPFDPTNNPAYVIADNFRCVWFYKNMGTNSNPDFQFITDRFFISEMIGVGSNAFPVIYDVNGDGLPDLLIGDFGYYDSSYYKKGYLYSDYTSKIAYYKNIGTRNNPLFHLETDDFANLSSLHLKGIYPTFGDLDGDGSDDMIIGNSDGTIIFFRNTAAPHNDPIYAQPQLHYKNIKTGTFSTPQLFDLDKDGLKDLIIGEQNGNLSYFRNIGTAYDPSFSLVTDSLGKINVTNYNLSYYGYSTPCFFRDKDGNTRLLVGSDEGKIHYFIDIDGHLNEKFIESDSLFNLVSGTPFQISSGWRTAPAIGNLTDSLFMDLIVGNYSGGLNYYSKGDKPQVISSVHEQHEPFKNHFTIFPNPADQFVNGVVSLSTQNKQITVSLIDVMGEILLESQTGQNFSLSLSNIPSGFYILRAGNLIQKLIIRH